MGKLKTIGLVALAGILLAVAWPVISTTWLWWNPPALEELVPPAPGMSAKEKRLYERYVRLIGDNRIAEAWDLIHVRRTAVRFSAQWREPTPGRYSLELTITNVSGDTLAIPQIIPSMNKSNGTVTVSTAPMAPQRIHAMPPGKGLTLTVAEGLHNKAACSSLQVVFFKLRKAEGNGMRMTNDFTKNVAVPK